MRDRFLPLESDIGTEFRRSVTLVIVRSIDDLRRLPSNRRANGFQARERIRVEIVTLPTCEKIHVESRLNRYQSRCGCTTGALVLVATIGFGAIKLVLSAQPVFSLQFFVHIVIVLVAAFFLGLTGKLVSLAATRMAFTCACSQLSKELSQDKTGVNYRL